MSTEYPSFNDPEKSSEEVVQDILTSLEGEEWKKVLLKESIGGNAGANLASVNAYIEKGTGRIVAFGNIQDLPKEVTSNPEYIEAHFIYNFGNSFKRLVNKELDIEPGFSKK